MLLEKRIPLGYILSGIKYDLLIVLAISTMDYWISVKIEIPPLPIGIPSFLGTAISLVLAFKLSQSYDRWWEARKIWGAVVNDSRTLVNQALNFASKEEEAQNKVRKIGKRQIAWCYALGRALRKQEVFDGLDKFMSKEELNNAAEHNNKPLALLNLHLRDIASLHKTNAINDFQQVQLDSTVQRLCDSMGKAERIKNTVFPKTYRMFLHFFIYIFLTTLSISVAEVEGPFQILLLLFVSAPFLLLERTAKLLQDPFENKPTDTSVTAIARTIEINLTQLMEEPVAEDTPQKEDFYIM